MRSRDARSRDCGGREREAVGIALAALAPQLKRYNRSMANYAKALLGSD